MAEKNLSELDLPRLVELSIPMTLADILKKWSHQAGCFPENLPKEIREKAYMDSLLAVFSLLARHHSELQDGEFVRAFRFFKDAGFTKRLSVETTIAERYGKLERAEPGFEPKAVAIEKPVELVVDPAVESEGTSGKRIIEQTTLFPDMVHQILDPNKEMK